MGSTRTKRSPVDDGERRTDVAALQRATPDFRALTVGAVLALQRSSGNAALASVLARQADPKPRSRELEARIDALGSRQNPASPHADERMRTPDAHAEPSTAPAPQLQSPTDLLAVQRGASNRAAAVVAGSSATVARAPRPGAKPDDPLPGLRFRGSLLVADAKDAMREATALQARATVEMGRVHKNIVRHLTEYRAAYSSIARDLREAAAEAARKQAMVDAITGIVIGTGVGMVMPKLLGSFRGLLTTSQFSGKGLPDLKGLRAAGAEAIGEGGELAVGSAVGGQATNPWTLPPELSADLADSKHWQELAEGWKGLAELAPGVTAFSNFNYALLEAVTGTAGPDELKAFLDEVAARGSSAKLRDQIADAEDALDEFMTLMDTPLLKRSGYELGQDILIKWIVNQAPEAEFTGPGSVKGGRLEAIDDFETVLAKWGVLRGPNAQSVTHRDTRLPVDFGRHWTSTRDTIDAYEEAVWEKRRLEQVGRLAVVIHAPFDGHAGAIRLDHAAYQAAGRPNPNPKSPQWRLAFRQQANVRAGQVVIVTNTAPRHVVVQPVEPFGPIARPPHKRRRAPATPAANYGPVDMSDEELERRGLDQAMVRAMPDDALAMHGIPPRKAAAAGANAATPPPAADYGIVDMSDEELERRGLDQATVRAMPDEALAMHGIPARAAPAAGSDGPVCVTDDEIGAPPNEGDELADPGLFEEEEAQAQ